MDRIVVSSSDFLTRPARSMYPERERTTTSFSCKADKVIYYKYLTSLTIVSQVLQPVLRGLCLLLQSVTLCPTEQISEGDEAMFTREHRGPPA